MPRLLAPAGVKIPPGRIGSAMKRRMGGERSLKNAARSIEENLPARYFFTVGSGRTALYLILRAIGGLQGNSKDAVVIPAYTCYSVAAAIARAGYRIKPVDVDPISLDYDYDALEATDLSDTLALVGCNLFGIVSDFARLRELSEKNSFRLIDDAAQSFGSKCGERESGTCGDAGFYSLDRGKNITTFSGGVIVTDDDNLAEAIRIRYADLPQPGFSNELVATLKLYLYKAMIEPGNYWYLTKIPFLGLGETIYDEDFAVEKLSNFQIALLSEMIREADRINSIRAENSSNLIDGLKDLNLQIPGSDRAIVPAYLRLPVLMPDRQKRERAISVLKERGITATGMYPGKISDISGIGSKLTGVAEEYPGADLVVDCLMTLPTHEFVCERDIDTIIKTMRDIL